MIIRHLDDIITTERDVETESWASRRLVLKRDHMGYSLHDTIIKAGSEVTIWYKNHLESAYCIEGSGELKNLDDGKAYPITPGTVYALNRNERHCLRAESDLRLLCVFKPALSGRETLDEDGALIDSLERDVFVIGLDEFNLALLENLENADQLNFIKLLDTELILEQQRYPIQEIIREAKRQLRSHHGTVDGIIHYIDFPVSTMVPILCGAYDLPSASLEAVLKCEHKYWSRVVQRAVVPEHIPLFLAFDPFDDEALGKITHQLDYPFWIKPVKSFSSYLGFRINNENDFKEAIPEIRQNIARFSEPFDYLLDMVEMPEELEEVRGGHCIAESIIGGRQCTQEGFVFKGEAEVYGTVDSFRESNLTTFSSYQYPSTLPKQVIAQMTELTQKVMRHIGYDNAPFNIEYYWDVETDRINLLEINPRISASHCYLFEQVDGSTHHKVAVDLALGRKPLFPFRKGRYRVAGKFFMREWEDAFVEAIPKPDIIRKLEQELVPDSSIHIVAQEGQRLSELMDQDGYSYRIALLFLGGADKQDLDNKRRLCENVLREYFRFT